jgi:hypothetical protein
MQLYKPHEHHKIKAALWFSAVMDTLLALGWLYVTGGYNSPYFMIFYIAILSIGLRFELQTTLLTGLLYAGAYIALLWATDGVEGHAGVILIRAGFVFIMGYFGHLLMREAETQVSERLSAQQIALQAGHAEEKLREVNNELENLVEIRTVELLKSLRRLE